MKIVKLKRGIANTTDSSASIGIMLVIVVLVLSIVYAAYNKFYAMAEVTLITNIVTETKQSRSSNGYGTSDYTTMLIQSGSLPKNSVSSGKIVNRSGGEITVKGAGTGFTVTDTLLSNSDCIKVAQQLGTSDMSSTKINGQSFTGEVTAVSATAACSTDSNTVVFTTKS